MTKAQTNPFTRYKERAESLVIGKRYTYPTYETDRGEERKKSALRSYAPEWGVLVGKYKHFLLFEHGTNRYTVHIHDVFRIEEC